LDAGIALVYIFSDAYYVHVILLSIKSLLNPQHPDYSSTLSLLHTPILFYPNLPPSDSSYTFNTVQLAFLETLNEPTHDIRNDLVRYQFAVLVPILSIFLPTCLIIPHLPVEEKNNEESEVEVGDRGIEPSR
jgi:hypothetical protein